MRKFGDFRMSLMRNREFFPINDFSNMRWGNIYPTDIDGFLDFKGKLFIIFELKYNGSKLPFGQKLALERLTDALKVPAYAIIASHNDTKDVRVECCEVLKYRHNGKWHDGSGNLKAFIDNLVKRYN